MVVGMGMTNTQFMDIIGPYTVIVHRYVILLMEYRGVIERRGGLIDLQGGQLGVEIVIGGGSLDVLVGEYVVVLLSLLHTGLHTTVFFFFAGIQYQSRRLFHLFVSGHLGFLLFSFGLILLFLLALLCLLDVE